MKIDTGCLLLENNDCEHILEHVDDGHSPLKSLEIELDLHGYEIKDIFQIHINFNYLELCTLLTSELWNRKK